MLTTLGLTTKNAILIVQFAKAQVEDGIGLIEATLEAAKLRLRPIVMTSLAFGFGVLPLALANGAGAGAQTAIGTAVLGGMVTSTLLVIFFAPLFYVMIYKAMNRTGRKDKRSDIDRRRSDGDSKGVSPVEEKRSGQDRRGSGANRDSVHLAEGKAHE
jgi:HAE1 family hydrophobic/amphiphilic exporter-1